MSQIAAFTYPRWGLGESVVYIPMSTAVYGLANSLFPISMLFVSKETGEDPLTGEPVKLVNALFKTGYRQSIMPLETLSVLIEEYDLVLR